MTRVVTPEVPLAKWPPRGEEVMGPIRLPDGYDLLVAIAKLVFIGLLIGLCLGAGFILLVSR